MTNASGSRITILRYSGELSTKARPTRYQFTQRLLANLRDALEAQGVEPRIEVSRDRIFVTLPPGVAEDGLARVFGVQSLSRAERHPAPDLASIVRHGEAIFREAVRGKRFAVRARRVGNRRPGDVATADLLRELGAALLPVSAGVDLDDPEVAVQVEVTGGNAFFFHERTPAPGGLPLGVGGRAVALVSGGFDSAVAAWQVLRRRISLDYVFCNLGGATHRLGTLRVTQVLADRWSYGDRPRFHTVDFRPVVEDIQARTRARYWQVLLKRQMLRTAERVAGATDAAAIVTGESIGQVSSQTLTNLATISQATGTLLLRPLVGSNKEDIIETSREIGTFDLAKVVGEYCDMVPRHPATAATLEAILAEEEALDLSLVDRWRSRTSRTTRFPTAPWSSTFAARPSSTAGTSRARCGSSSATRSRPTPPSTAPSATSSPASSASRARTWPSSCARPASTPPTSAAARAPSSASNAARRRQAPSGAVRTGFEPPHRLPARTVEARRGQGARAKA